MHLLRYLAVFLLPAICLSLLALRQQNQGEKLQNNEAV